MKIKTLSLCGEGVLFMPKIKTRKEDFAMSLYVDMVVSDMEFECYLKHLHERKMAELARKKARELVQKTASKPELLPAQ